MKARLAPGVEDKENREIEECKKEIGMDPPLLRSSFIFLHYFDLFLS